MKNMKIVATGSFLPRNKVDNKVIANELNITEEFIYKRTGIKTRYYSDDETIEQMAIKSVCDLIEKNYINNSKIETNIKKIDISKVDMIIVATTSTNLLMPGISYKVQEHFNIKNCMCLDILAGCSGFINAIDIARNYIELEKASNVLVIGVDILSKFTDETDLSTSIILADGAGAVLIEKTEDNKKYESIITSDGQNGNILICKSNENIKMDGREIYKYAVTETVKNIKKLLKISNLDMNEIKYIVPHQSNFKIMNSIANRLEIDISKMYMNIENVGNTFCASIPIAIDEMFEKNLLKEEDKIILLGYGGGLNTGSILMEI